MDSILIPVKRLDRSKLRLAPAISPEGRRALSLAMLADVLEATSRWPSRFIVTSDPAAGALGERFSCRLVPDPGNGLNEAIRAGTEAALMEGCGRLLVLAADLPMVTTKAIEKLLSYREEVVIAPSHDGGTNALARRPPDAIPASYGPASAKAHLELAHSAGLTARTVQLPPIMLDVDQPDDLTSVTALANGSRSARLARDLLGTA
ncbi:MAG: 2-phospho-L-lactate guanylyltransferase [Actinomycetota bacterium]|nr:2-phospho-L-lactate guanylyltransferase [Actinomycetota bacterium]